MKILILGQKGNLGSQLAKTFEKEENKVAGLDREDVDITNKELILAKIKQIKPEVIINAAAYNAVDKCEEEKIFELAKKINSEAVGCLAQICAKMGIIFIHYSSDYVFDGNKKTGYNEKDQPNPINKYGQSKLLGEEAIKKTKNLKYYLIRTSKLFGPKGSSPLAKPNFFDLMLKLAREKKELDVIDGEKSCFTYTQDLARATKRLISQKKEYGIYHITNSLPATWYEAAKTLFEITKNPIKINPVTSNKLPRPAKRPKCSILQNTKLPPLRSYKQALKEYLKSK